MALKAAFSKKIPADTAHHCAFASALLAWGLLLTIAPQPIVEEQVTRQVAFNPKIFYFCLQFEIGQV